MSTLADLPQLSEKILYQGFFRIHNSLKAMHKLDLVHMDVKSANLFVGGVAEWDLGDFGSTRKINTTARSYTDAFAPFSLSPSATVIPAMDFVLLCVTIAVELNKKLWRKDLCGHQEKVQAHLIIEKLNSIEDVDFKREVVELFEDNLKIVQEHLRNF